MSSNQFAPFNVINQDVIGNVKNVLNISAGLFTTMRVNSNVTPTANLSSALLVLLLVVSIFHFIDLDKAK
jgi:hypothetical protein